jgi:hypothetical protein
VVIEEGGQQLLWFDGLLPLPVGSSINIDNIPGGPQVALDPELFPTGRADAIVVELNLWGTQGDSRVLVLRVQLTDPGGQGEDFAFLAP